MYTKMILPLLGGSPSVWNGALVFFQGTLLLGYLYAHLTARWLSVGRQIVLHLVLLLAAVVTLPVAVPAGWTPPSEANPLSWLFGVLALGVGLPFTVLAGISPMLQRWFAHSDHPEADNPYPLYAISNLGSLAALLCYPFLLEPALALSAQSALWSGVFGLLILLTAVSGVLTWRSSARTTSDTATALPVTTQSDPAASEPPVTWCDRAWWIGLAFVPSSLLLGATRYLTTDVAAVPLLWVIPLALYLLTFVIVFARRRRVFVPRTARLLQVLSVAVLVLFLFWGIEAEVWWLYAMHLTAFFFSALVVHGELATRRPAPVHLTSFYLWMSLGGVLGGMFNVLLAPVIFNSVVEYELMLVVACALGVGWRDVPWRRSLRVHGAALVPLLALGPFLFGENPDIPPTYFVILVTSGVALLALLSLKHEPLHLAAGIAGVLVIGGIYQQRWEGVVYAERSFFGSYSVRHDPVGNFHLLRHGTTTHGGQFLDAARRTEPVTYYHRAGPFGQLVNTLGPGFDSVDVAVIGLGTGAQACHGREQQAWTFYEIDPGIARLATDPRYFTYLRDCPPTSTVQLGDGRIAIGNALPASYGMIVLDAFSSDAVPVHLLTREAFTLYLEKLTPDGMLVLHVSNRYLNLVPVVAGVAADLGLTAWLQSFNEATPEQQADLLYDSDWVVLSRAELSLEQYPGWLRIQGDAAMAWTDDHSDVIGLLRWR